MDCASLDASIESLRRPQLNHYCNFPLNPHVRLLVGCKDSQSVGVGKSNFTRCYRNTCLINYYIFRCAGSISVTLPHMNSAYGRHTYYIASHMTDFQTPQSVTTVRTSVQQERRAPIASRRTCLQRFTSIILNLANKPFNNSCMREMLKVIEKCLIENLNYLVFQSTAYTHTHTHTHTHTQTSPDQNG